MILVVSRELIPSRLDLPRSLQTFNTQVVEILNADWGNPTTLASIGPHLENLCEFWENIHQAHAAAMNIFEAAQTRSAPYCLYLRSFSRVSDVEVAVPQGRAVGYVNDQRLDRNIARALADRASILNPVTCLHTDDLGLLAGEWILPSFRVHISPKIPARLGKPYYAVATAHAALGSFTEVAALYILLSAGTNVLPQKLRLTNYKLWMRTVLALWWLTLLFGFATYARWYIPSLLRK